MFIQLMFASFYRNCGENLKIFQVTWPPGRSRRAYGARAGSDSCGSGSRWASELWNGGPWNVKPVEKVRKMMEK